MVRIQGSGGMSFFDDRCLADYMNDIAGSKPLSRAEEKAIFQRIQDGDRRAINLLVEANLKFVISVCFNYRNQGMSLSDLVNEGNLGLIRAAQRFDATLEFRFISYAVWWVRQAVLSALAAQSRLFPVSTNRVGLIGRVDRAAAKLQQAMGREPSVEEIADAARVPPSEVEALRSLNAMPCSLDGPDGSGTPEPEADSREAGSPEDGARRLLLGRVMESMLEDLSARDREIIRLYHGLGLETGYSMRDIGDRYGISRFQVAGILKRAAAELREAPEAAKLKRIVETVAA